ncbi:MAG: hypothetical protein QXR93_05985 [Archaeoglobaceae archaeon]
MDEEIEKEKAPQVQAGLKEIFGHIAIQAGLTDSYSVSDFITSFWDLTNRLDMNIYHKAIAVLSRAKLSEVKKYENIPSSRC